MSLTLTILLFSFSAMGGTSGIQHWKSSDILGSIPLILALDKDNMWQPFGTGVLIDIDSLVGRVLSA